MAKKSTHRQSLPSAAQSKNAPRSNKSAARTDGFQTADEIRATCPSEAIKAVEHVAQWYLRKNKHAESNVVSSAQLYEALKAINLLPDITKGTFQSYISDVANNAESPIACNGRGPNSGYYISDATEAMAKDLAEPSKATEAESTYNKREAHLYPPLIHWLRKQGYRAQDTSQIKGNGKWGNPDVTGIETTDVLGVYKEINIATIEAKLGMEQYEYDFFQAVSHRRFANRAYFAFAIPANTNKVPRDLRYFSECFGVGVLVVELPDDLLMQLTTGSLTEQDKARLGELNDESVREVYSASPHRVPFKQQHSFLEALGINSGDTLVRWPRLNDGDA